MGNSAQGSILSGNVQGVIAGPGLTIDASGSIQIDSQTVIGVMKLGQTPTSAAGAYNGYTWPTTPGLIGQQLATNGSGTLSWSDPDGLAWTAKGQIVVGTGVDTQTFLNVGANGTILIADNSQVSGLAYTSNYVPTAGATTAAFLPAGNTGNRPSLSAGQAGAIRYNASTTSMELWNGTSWETIASDAVTGFVPQTSPTGSAVMPAGSDGSRDASPAAGYTRFNTTSASLEVWNGTAWTLVGAPPTGGLGINVTGGIVKVSIPSSSSPPPVGGSANQAVVGSLFWNDVLNQLFIYYSNGGTPVWVQAAPAASGGGGGGSGSVTSVDITAGTGITSTGGPIVTAGSITVGLANTAVTPGAYTSANITVDAQGRITSAANGSGGGGTVTGVTGTAPIVSSGGAAPAISITPATAVAAGSMSAADKAKLDGAATIVSSVDVSGGTTGLTYTGGPVTTSGTITAGGTLAIANGGTGATTAVAAINALLPPQAGQAGNQLGTNGTNVSWVASGVELPSGTVLAFFQAAAPTGWTQVTTAALNNSAIRIVTTAGGGTGGTIGFSTLFSPTSAYTGTVNITSGQVGDTSLSVAQLASHTHSFDVYAGSGYVNAYYVGNSPQAVSTTNATGGNATHTHTLVGVSANGNFTSNFDLQYINMIVASKN